MVDIGGTSDSRRICGCCAGRDFCLAWEGADGVGDFTDRPVFEGIRLGYFCFLAIGSPKPEESGSSRFLGREKDEGASCSGGRIAVIIEGLNLDGVPDPRSATSCGLVHFE